MEDFLRDEVLGSSSKEEGPQDGGNGPPVNNLEGVTEGVENLGLGVDAMAAAEGISEVGAATTNVEESSTETTTNEENSDCNRGKGNPFLKPKEEQVDPNVGVNMYDPFGIDPNKSIDDIDMNDESDHIVDGKLSEGDSQMAEENDLLSDVLNSTETDIRDFPKQPSALFDEISLSPNEASGGENPFVKSVAADALPMQPTIAEAQIAAPAQKPKAVTEKKLKQVEAGEVVILGKGGAELRTRTKSLQQKAETQYHVAVQLFHEKFKKDKEGLITEDDNSSMWLMHYKAISNESNQLKKLLKDYRKHLDAMNNSEKVLSQYLQEHGIRDPTPVGQVMRTLADALKDAGKKRAPLDQTLETFDGDVGVYCDRVLRDTNLTVKKLEKQRIAFDANRVWLQGIDKEKKPEKYTQVEKQLADSEEEFHSMRRDGIIKIQMVSDHRLQLMSRNIQSYHRTVTEFLLETTEVFKETLGSQKALIEEDSSHKSILGV